MLCMFQAPQYRTRHDIVISGSEIPAWFSHQSLGAEVNIKEPYSHLCNELMGIVVCVVFCSQDNHPHHQIDNYHHLTCWLIANGKQMSVAPFVSVNPKVISSNLWLLYMGPKWYTKVSKKLLWECNANGFSQVGIKISNHGSTFKVKKCGLCMVYKKDIEDLNRSTV